SRSQAGHPATDNGNAFHAKSFMRPDEGERHFDLGPEQALCPVDSFIFPFFISRLAIRSAIATSQPTPQSTAANHSRSVRATSACLASGRTVLRQCRCHTESPHGHRESR